MMCTVCNGPTPLGQLPEAFIVRQLRIHGKIFNKFTPCSSVASAELFLEEVLVGLL